MNARLALSVRGLLLCAAAGLLAVRPAALDGREKAEPASARGARTVAADASDFRLPRLEEVVRREMAALEADAPCPAAGCPLTGQAPVPSAGPDGDATASAEPQRAWPFPFRFGGKAPVAKPAPQTVAAVPGAPAIQQAGQQTPAPVRPGSVHGTVPVDEKSATLKRLEELYARDGLPMPPMHLTALPKTTDGALQATQQRDLQRKHNSAAMPQPAPATAASPRSALGFLQRVFGRKPTATPVAQSPPHAQAPRARQIPPGAVAAQRPAVAEPMPQVRTNQGASAPPPHVPRTGAESRPAIADRGPAPGADPWNNPFTDVSEADADHQIGFAQKPVANDPRAEAAPRSIPAAPESPFTGLRLAEEEDRPRRATAVAEQRPAPPGDAAAPGLLPRHLPREQRSKFAQIAQRGDQPGFKGFCPVALRDERELIDCRPEFYSTYGPMTYFFSSGEAQARFEGEPEKYLPAGGGNDVILLVNQGEEVEGSIDHAVWFRNRLYMFSSPASMATFAKNPARYAVDD